MSVTNHPLFPQYRSELEKAIDLFKQDRTDRETIRAFEKCVKTARKIDDPDDLYQSLAGLGSTYFKSYNENQDPSDLENAKKSFTEALPFTERSHRQKERTDLLMNLGRVVYLQNDDWKLMYQYYVEAAKIAKKTKDEGLLNAAETMIHAIKLEHPTEVNDLEGQKGFKYTPSRNIIEATMTVEGAAEDTGKFDEMLMSGELTQRGVFDSSFPQPDHFTGSSSRVDGDNIIEGFSYPCTFYDKIPIEKFVRLSEIFPHLSITLDNIIDETNSLAGHATWEGGIIVSDKIYKPDNEEPSVIVEPHKEDLTDADFISSINRKDESIDPKYNKTLQFVASLLDARNPQQARHVLEQEMNDLQSRGDKENLNLARTMLAIANRTILEDGYSDPNEISDSNEYFVEALNSLSEAEQYFTKTDNLDRTLDVYLEQASTYLVTNRLDQALKIIEKHNKIALQTARFHQLQLGYGHLGKALSLQKKYKESLKAYKRQELISKKHKITEGIAYALYNQGWYYREQNDPVNARKYFKEALPYCKEAGFYDLQNDLENFIKQIDDQKKSAPPSIPSPSNGKPPKLPDRGTGTPPPLTDHNTGTPPPLVQKAEQSSNDLIPESWGMPLIIALLIIMVGSGVLFFVVHGIFWKIVFLIIFGLLLWFFISSKVFTIERKQK